jgi:hypothetical protein
MKRKSEFDYFDKPENIKKLWIILYVICGLLVVPDFVLHRHPHFGFDGFFGFYAILGFVSCAILILFSKLVGLVLKVKENYYDK